MSQSPPKKTPAVVKGLFEDEDEEDDDDDMFNINKKPQQNNDTLAVKGTVRRFFCFF